MANIQAQFQMLDNYVKEYSLKTLTKLSETMEIAVNGQVSFGIVKITENEEELIGEIELTNNLDLIEGKEVKAQIKIVMRGLFKYSNKKEKEEFEQMLKIHGATTLSHLIRAYIHTNTSISGMPRVITPMINFVELFNKNNNS